MSIRVYKDLSMLLEDLDDKKRAINQELRNIFLKIPWVSEAVKWNCLHFQYPNWMWVYVNSRKQKHPVLWVSRGAWICKEYPIFLGVFDEILAVVAKINLPSKESVNEKWIATLANFLSELPPGIWIGWLKK